MGAVRWVRWVWYGVRWVRHGVRWVRYDGTVGTVRWYGGCGTVGTVGAYQRTILGGPEVVFFPLAWPITL